VLKRSAWLGTVVAVLGIAATSAVSVSTAAAVTKKREASAAKELAKALKACKKDKSKSKLKKCKAAAQERYKFEISHPNWGEELPPAGAISATLVIEVPSGPPPPGVYTRLSIPQPIEIIHLGLVGEDLSSFQTTEQTIHVAPGTYRIWALAGEEGPAFGPMEEVTVAAGQTRDVMLAYPVQ
jgi:hypothetical protein